MNLFAHIAAVVVDEAAGSVAGCSSGASLGTIEGDSIITVRVDVAVLPAGAIGDGTAVGACGALVGATAAAAAAGCV